VSKQNKANKSNYDQAGRLSPDDLARERAKQGEFGSASQMDHHPQGPKQPIPGESESNRPRSAPEE
jgi:hypothetical protein